MTDLPLHPASHNAKWRKLQIKRTCQIPFHLHKFPKLVGLDFGVQYQKKPLPSRNQQKYLEGACMRQTSKVVLIFCSLMQVVITSDKPGENHIQIVFILLKDIMLQFQLCKRKTNPVCLCPYEKREVDSAKCSWCYHQELMCTCFLLIFL